MVCVFLYYFSGLLEKFDLRGTFSADNKNVWKNYTIFISMGSLYSRKISSCGCGSTRRQRRPISESGKRVTGGRQRRRNEAEKKKERKGAQNELSTYFLLPFVVETFRDVSNRKQSVKAFHPQTLSPHLPLSFIHIYPFICASIYACVSVCAATLNIPAHCLNYEVERKKL